MHNNFRNHVLGLNMQVLAKNKSFSLHICMQNLVFSWSYHICTNECLTQKDFLGEKERIFLINRTEHPRLVERVRCLCMGCDVTWGPPCQALVTQLPANRR